MSPREVAGLQSLAMAHGGTLTINPQTGLPEAGFLDSLLPTLLGGAATFFSGGTITPFMAALGVGGLTALTSKDLGKGLMAGLGAYGGSGIVEGLAGFGAADIGEKAVSSAMADATNAGFVNGSIGLDPTGMDISGADAYAAAVQKGVRDRMAGATYSDRLAAGASKALSNPMGAFNSIGGGSVFNGALKVGAPLLSALSSQDQTSVPTFEQIKFDPRYANVNINRQQLPYQRDTGSSAQRSYFGPTYVTQYADGGEVEDAKADVAPAGVAPAGVAPAAADAKAADIASNSGGYDGGYGGGYDGGGDPGGGGGAQAKGGLISKRKSKMTKNLKGLMALSNGGVTLDPDYDYSGYGRKKKDLETPVTPLPDVPKPDFLAADGKTYRYDSVKKRWYVIKEAEEKTNPGVQTLMGDSGGPGGAEGGIKGGGGGITGLNIDPLAYGMARVANLYSSPVSLTPAPVTDATFNPTQAGKDYAGASGKSSWGKSGNAEQDIGFSAVDPQTGLQGQGTTGQTGLYGDAAAGMSSNTAQQGFRAGELNSQNIADQTQRDAVTSAPSPTATGGKANSPSGIASLGIGLAPAVEAQAEKNQINAQVEQDAAMQSQATREAKSVENARDVGQKAMASDIAALVSELSDNPNDNPGRAPSLGTGTTAGWGGSDIGGSDLGGGGEGLGGGGEGNGSQFAYGGMAGYAQGGLGSLGGYSDGGRLLRGPGDGVSDSIPATVGGRQPARLADGEFVVPARIVSELGNGSTEAGARALYKMMDRIQANRRKTTGKNSVAVNSKSHKYLPA